MTTLANQRVRSQKYSNTVDTILPGSVQAPQALSTLPNTSSVNKARQHTKHAAHGPAPYPLSQPAVYPDSHTQSLFPYCKPFPAHMDSQRSNQGSGAGSGSGSGASIGTCFTTAPSATTHEGQRGSSPPLLHFLPPHHPLPSTPFPPSALPQLSCDEGSSLLHQLALAAAAEAEAREAELLSSQPGQNQAQTLQLDESNGGFLGDQRSGQDGMATQKGGGGARRGSGSGSARNERHKSPGVRGGGGGEGRRKWERDSHEGKSLKVAASDFNRSSSMVEQMNPKLAPYPPPPTTTTLFPLPFLPSLLMPSDSRALPAASLERALHSFDTAPLNTFQLYCNGYGALPQYWDPNAPLPSSNISLLPSQGDLMSRADLVHCPPDASLSPHPSPPNPPSPPTLPGPSEFQVQLSHLLSLNQPPSLSTFAPSPAPDCSARVLPSSTLPSQPPTSYTLAPPPPLSLSLPPHSASNQHPSSNWPDQLNQALNHSSLAPCLGTTTEISHGGVMRSQAELCDPNLPLACLPGGSLDGNMPISEVQTQLEALHAWYVTNQNHHLEKARAHLRDLERSCAEKACAQPALKKRLKLGTSAVLKAMDRAVQIMQMSAEGHGLKQATSPCLPPTTLLPCLSALTPPPPPPGVFGAAGGDACDEALRACVKEPPANIVPVKRRERDAVKD